jgi:hypothetical protein
VRRLAPPEHDSVALTVDEQAFVGALGHLPTWGHCRGLDLRRWQNASG